jgi:hypothetical protein
MDIAGEEEQEVWIEFTPVLIVNDSISYLRTVKINII